VEVDEGIVTLRGTVSSYAKLRAAEELAGRMPLVRAVVNELLVRDDGVDRDVQLAQSVRTALDLDTDVPSEGIQCFVRNGHVTLRGLVDFAYQRAAAERVAARTAGVRGLTVEIALRGSSRSDLDIEGDVREALARRGDPSRSVDVRVAAAVVTLSGRVPRLADRIAAESTAWNTRGVRHVVDRVQVLGG
jgi:osmotically-inducible protein OsmY